MRQLESQTLNALPGLGLARVRVPLLLVEALLNGLRPLA
jgi:hypothetical protein